MYPVGKSLENLLIQSLQKKVASYILQQIMKMKLSDINVCRGLLGEMPNSKIRLSHQKTCSAVISHSP